MASKFTSLLPKYKLFIVYFDVQIRSYKEHAIKLNSLVNYMYKLIKYLSFSESVNSKKIDETNDNVF